MKKYYMAFVDFTEIANVTSDEAQLEKAKMKMMEFGFLTEKGNPSSAQIKQMTEAVSAPFFDKLKRRINRRPGGIVSAKNTLQKLCEQKEYIAFYLYLTILYGFMEWAVPEQVLLLPAEPNALKIFSSYFISSFEAYLVNSEKEDKEA